MGFEQFGIVSFTANTKAEQFVDFLKSNDLKGTVCIDCGAKFFPPRTDCNVCLGRNMDWYAITGQGTLLSFTKAMFAPAGFEKDVPYMLGVAEFDDGTKVFGRLDKTTDESVIKPGLKVRVKIVRLENDRVTYELAAV
jgi:hypothetical protein